nr:hypothetical protein [Pyrococcus abyssi]
MIPPYIIAIVSTLLMIAIALTSNDATYILIMALVFAFLDISKYYLLLLIPMFFLLIPRPVRELGIVSLGLFMVSPYIRSLLNEEEVLRLFLLELLLFLLISPKPRNVILKGLWLVIISLGTVVLQILTPVAMLIPVSYLLAIPRSALTYLYIAITSVGIAVLYDYGMISFPNFYLPVFQIYEVSLIPVILILYSIFREKKEILKKKQTLMLFILLLLMTPFIGEHEVEFSFLLSTVSVRLITSLPHEETL